MENIHDRLFVATRPDIGKLVAEMRQPDIQCDSLGFIRRAERIGTYLAGESLSRTPYHTHLISVPTPLGEADYKEQLGYPLIVTVLRAALPMSRGAREVFSQSPEWFIDVKREEGPMNEDGTMDVSINYQTKLLVDMKHTRLVVPDIMLATGSSLVGMYKTMVTTHGEPLGVDVLAAIGTLQGAERVLNTIPNSRVFLAAMDPRLNGMGYIVPGLGDAGDLCYPK